MAENKREGVLAPPSFLLFSFDLEATGLKVLAPVDERDQITEFGFKVAAVWADKTNHTLTYKYVQRQQFVDKGEEDKGFQQYVKATRQASAKVQAITGITAKTLEGAAPLADALQMVRDYINEVGSMFDTPEYTVPRHLIGQNVGHKKDPTDDKLQGFDVGLLTAEIESVGGGNVGSKPAFNWFKQCRFDFLIDTLPLCREVVDSTLLPRNAKDGRAIYTLSNCYKATTQKELTGAHGALVDASGVLELLLNYEAFYVPFLKDLESEQPRFAMNLMDYVSEMLKILPKQTLTIGERPAKKTKTLFDMGFSSKKE